MAPLYASEGETTPGMCLGPAGQRERYELVAKLGDSSESKWPAQQAPKVWKARDQLKDRLVVIKIINNNVNTDASSIKHGEAWSLWRIAGYEDARRQPASVVPSKHPGQAHCVAILDSFYLLDDKGEEPAGEEEDFLDVAIVFELLGPTVKEWQQGRATPFLPLDLVRSLIRQILLALHYLHSEVNITHQGLSLSNLLLPLEYASSLDEKNPPTPFLRLCGFGWTPIEFQLSDHYYHRPGSTATAAPEQLILDSYSQYFGKPEAADVWAVGILASQLLFDKDLVNHQVDRSLYSSGFPDLQSGRAEPWQIVNYASLDRKAGWSSFFDTSRNSQPDFSAYSDFPFYLPGVVPLPSIRDRILAEPASSSFSPSEVDLLDSLLKACWTLNPYKRVSAKELLEHEFVKGVEL